MDRKRAKQAVGLTVGFGISAVCMIWFIRSVDDWGEIWETVRSIDRAYFIISVAITLAVYAVRALRWGVLLSPIKRARLSNLFSATCVGYMANTLLPARLGEFVRPWVLSRSERMRFSQTLATAVMERVFDMVGLLIMIIITWIALNPEKAADAEAIEKLQAMKRYGVLMVAASAGVLAGLFVLAVRPGFVRRVAGVFTGPLPEGLRSKLLGLLDSVLDAFGIMKSARQVGVVVLLSCVWWFMIGGSMAILALAFDLNTGFFGGCFIAALVALAVALPQAPGFLGVFPMAAKLGLKLMGLGGGAASGYALVLWLMSVLPVAVMGMACTWREGLSVGQIAGGRAGAAGDEAPGTSPPGTSPPP